MAKRVTQKQILLSKVIDIMGEENRQLYEKKTAAQLQVVLDNWEVNQTIARLARKAGNERIA